MKKLSITCMSIALLAQLVAGQRDLKAGFSTQSLSVDVETVTGEVGNLGVQHLDGEIFVTTRIEPKSGGMHFVTVFDRGGAKLRSWFQPAFAQASEWGFRDGASDGNNLFFGFELGIEIMDKDGVLLDGLAGPNLQTANGPATVFTGLIAGNVLDPEQAGISRALAYDRTGHGGEGSFWTGNFDSSTFEIDTDGDILLTYPNAGESSFGFGIDPISDSGLMWINAAPNAGAMAEYDLTTGTLTGRVMDLGLHLSSQGGLDIVPGTLGRGPRASGYDILHLQQGLSNAWTHRPDEIRIRRLHLDVEGLGRPPSPVTRPGALEPDLLASIDSEAVFERGDRASLNYTLDSFELDVFFDIARNPGDGLGNGGLNGVPAIVFANIGPDAALGIEVTSNLLGIRELAHLQPLLTVPSAAVGVRSMGMVLTNDPMSPSPSEWRIALTRGMPFAPIGDCVRFQGMWIDPDVAFLPIAFTNQLRLCRGPCGCPFQSTFAEFQGGNTFNANTTSGYNSVTNEESNPDLSIVRLTYSINPGDPSNSALTQQLFDNFFRWDTDNAGMADIFEGGNSLTTGCLGTYRNGSEVSTGLIFAGTPHQNATPCDLDSLQGWVGTDDGVTAFGAFDGDWLTLEFTFSPDTFMNGAVFEFDCDTDGGIGVSGNAMAGVIVEVEFKNGSISRGEVVADPNNPGRAFVQL